MGAAKCVFFKRRRGWWLKYSVGTAVALNVAVFWHIGCRCRSAVPVSQICNSVFVLARPGSFLWTCEGNIKASFLVMARSYLNWVFDLLSGMWIAQDRPGRCNACLLVQRDIWKMLDPNIIILLVDPRSSILILYKPVNFYFSAQADVWWPLM